MLEEDGKVIWTGGSAMGREREWKGQGVFRGSSLVFKSDFTNGMDVGVASRTGRSRAASCLVAPSPAVLAGLPWYRTIP